MEIDLLSPLTTVHDLIEAKGRQGAKELANRAQRESGRLAPIDVLSGRRGPRIIEAAASVMGDDTEAAKGYVYAAWSHTGLPHKRPRDDAAKWRIDTDYATLLVEPGTRVHDDGTETAIGVPFGAYARLVLIDWQTDAIENNSRDIYVGPSMKASLRRMGLPHGGRVMELIREQVERLSACRFTFHMNNNGRGGILNQNIVDAMEYQEASSTATITRRFVERVRLSEVFYQQLRRYPVTVDKAAVIAIRNSPMALDLYLWLVYRLHALEAETPITWSALWRQFGAGVSRLKNFKPVFAENIQLALGVYRSASVAITPTGVVLKPSPPPKPLQSITFR
jgi:hypothetical protein